MHDDNDQNNKKQGQGNSSRNRCEEVASWRAILEMKAFNENMMKAGGDMQMPGRILRARPSNANR